MAVGKYCNGGEMSANQSGKKKRARKSTGPANKGKRVNYPTK